MAAPPVPAPVFASAPALAGLLARVIVPLINLIARRFLREPRLIPLILPLCARINHARHRFERLMARLAAGRLPAPRHCEPRAARRSNPPPAPPQAARRSNPPPVPTGCPRLPCGHGWLLRLLGHEVAAYASQLEAVLAEPAAVELLALVPAAGRILHPIRWILGFIPRAPRRRTVRAHRPPRRRPRRRPNIAAPAPRSGPFPYYPSANWPTHSHPPPKRA